MSPSEKLTVLIAILSFIFSIFTYADGKYERYIDNLNNKAEQQTQQDFNSQILDITNQMLNMMQEYMESSNSLLDNCEPDSSIPEDALCTPAPITNFSPKSYATDNIETPTVSPSDNNP